MKAARAADGRVEVGGGGAIGLCTVAAVHATGARVAIEARHDVPRAAANRLGAAPLTDGYDVCFEASGTASGFARATEICRPGGRIALVGTFWESCELPAMQVCMKKLDILPASAYACGRHPRHRPHRFAARAPTRDRFDTDHASLPARGGFRGVRDGRAA